jgi:hypothetical protein
VRKTAAALRLTEPWKATWKPSREFVNSMLAGKASEAESVRIVDLPSLELSLNALGLAMGGEEGSGPLKPGVFALDVGVNAGQATVLLPDSGAGRQARTERRLTTESLRASIKSVAVGSGVGIDLETTLGRITGAAGAGEKESILKAQLRDLASPTGAVQADKAVVSADADMAAFPTPIIDALANQGGLLTELLGPTVSLNAKLRDVTKSADAATGSVQAKMTSERASADVMGNVVGGKFVQTGQTEIKLIEVRPQLVQELAGSLPMVSSVEKTKDDEPGLITFANFQAPLNNDLRNLNGTISVDLGIVRFSTENSLSKLVKGLGGRESGVLGRRIEPFVVQINQGVANYQRFKLPLGEFSLETEGKVDLVARRIDVVTYVPFFALTDEALGLFQVGLGNIFSAINQDFGKIIDRNTLVPIRTRGPLDNPETAPDFTKLVEEAQRKLIQDPAKGVGDLIGDILGGGKDKK